MNVKSGKQRRGPGSAKRVMVSRHVGECKPTDVLTKRKSLTRDPATWIIVVGCGGIAYQAMPMLTALVNQLLHNMHHVVFAALDPDRIEEENYTRQWGMFKDKTSNAKGKYKVDLLKKAIEPLLAPKEGFFLAKRERADEEWFQLIGKRIPFRDEVILFCWPDNDLCRWQVADWFRKHICTHVQLANMVTAGCTNDTAQAFAVASVLADEAIDEPSIADWRDFHTPKQSVEPCVVCTEPTLYPHHERLVDEQGRILRPLCQTCHDTEHPPEALPDDAPMCGEQTALSNQAAAMASAMLMTSVREEWLPGSPLPEVWWEKEKGRMYTVENETKEKTDARNGSGNSAEKDGDSGKESAAGATGGRDQVVALEDQRALLPGKGREDLSGDEGRPEDDSGGRIALCSPVGQQGTCS